MVSGEGFRASSCVLLDRVRVSQAMYFAYFGAVPYGKHEGNNTEDYLVPRSSRTDAERKCRYEQPHCCNGIDPTRQAILPEQLY